MAICRYFRFTFSLAAQSTFLPADITISSFSFTAFAVIVFEKTSIPLIVSLPSILPAACVNRNVQMVTPRHKTRRSKTRKCGEDIGIRYRSKSKHFLSCRTTKVTALEKSNVTSLLWFSTTKYKLPAFGNNIHSTSTTFYLTRSLFAAGFHNVPMFPAAGNKRVLVGIEFLVLADSLSVEDSFFWCTGE